MSISKREIDELTAATQTGRATWRSTGYGFFRTGGGWELFVSSGGVEFLSHQAHDGPYGERGISNWFGLFPRARAIRRLTKSINACYDGEAGKDAS